MPKMQFLERKAHRLAKIARCKHTDSMKKETEQQHTAGEFACSAWLDALAKNLQAEGSRLLTLGINNKRVEDRAAALVLNGIGTAIARARESASNAERIRAEIKL